MKWNEIDEKEKHRIFMMHFTSIAHKSHILYPNEKQENISPSY